MVQNLIWSGLYIRTTLLSCLLQKVMKLVSLISTRPGLYVAAMTTVLSDSYASLVETLNHMKSLKIKYHPGDDVAYFSYAILVNAGRLDSYRAFNLNHLGYIIRIFEDTSGYILNLWETRKYKDIVDFIKILCVCVKRMSFNLMISLSMGFFFKKLCMNTATFLNQRSGNPLIVRKI